MGLCLRAMAKGDAILLIEDGVYNLLSEQLQCQHFVLEVDAKARGVALSKHGKAIDYDEFVALTVNNDNVISWF